MEKQAIILSASSKSSYITKSILYFLVAVHTKILKHVLSTGIICCGHCKKNILCFLTLFYLLLDFRTIKENNTTEKKYTVICDLMFPEAGYIF